jgi:hypothetical protein
MNVSAAEQNQEEMHPSGLEDKPLNQAKVKDLKLIPNQIGSDSNGL